jgi:hypothetical protein
MNQQPSDARSLDLGLRHLGFLVRCNHRTQCAVCGETIPAGSQAIESACTNALAHRACGELLQPGGST